MTFDEIIDRRGEIGVGLVTSGANTFEHASSEVDLARLRSGANEFAECGKRLSVRARRIALGESSSQRVVGAAHGSIRSCSWSRSRRVALCMRLLTVPSGMPRMVLIS